MNTTQTTAWSKEYKELSGIPTSVNKESSSSAKHFVKFLKSKNTTNGSMLDIGCGLGRNSIFLAQSGFKVWAFDIVEHALKNLEQEAEQLHLPIHTSIQSASENWQYQDNFFDAALDICVFDNMVTKEMKNKYLHELRRVLKPGGYFCILAILADDGYYAPLLEKSDKKDTYILHDPENDIWSSMLPKEDLRNLLAEFFEIVEVEDVKKKDVLMYGKKYDRSLARFIVHKPMKRVS